MEDLHAALGYGKFSARQVLQKLAPGQVAEKEATADASGVRRSRPSTPPVAGKAGEERRSRHQGQRASTT